MENGGCTVFGCNAAPVEEAMVHVDADEVARAEAAQVGLAPGGAVAGAVQGDTTGVAPPPAVWAGNGGSGVGAGFLHANDPFAAAFPHAQVQLEPTVDRSYYVLLAVIAGFLGAHNLYANRTSTGIIQLCITLGSCLLALPVMWIWAFVEAATVEVDGDGVGMRQ